ncbi:MAG: TolC family protein [Bacteroidota bacterium]
MKIKPIFFTLLLFSFAPLMFAQESMSLNQLIGMGLEQNFSIQIARNTETIAKNNFTKGNAGYLPSIDLSSRYSGTLNNTTQNLREGGQVITTDIYNTTANAALSLGMTLFDGFNVQTTYKKLDELKQLGELNTQLSIQNLIADIVSAYSNYIKQLQVLVNLKYALTLSRERLRIDEERYLLGSSSKLQVLQSRVYLNADSSYLSKQYEVVRAAQISLNELTAPDNLEKTFYPIDSAIIVNQELIYDKLLNDTYLKNTALEIASKNKSVSAYDYKLIASRSYPYLSFSSGYSYNLNSYSGGTNLNQQTTGMNYALNLGFNVFDGHNQKRSLNNSSIDMKNKALKYKEIEQGIKADLFTIYHAYSNNLRLIKLEEQNLQTATENLEIALERYKLGSLSGIDLREVQKSLLDARESLISIQYQTKLAEISLVLISGNIMDYYK